MHVEKPQKRSFLQLIVDYLAYVAVRMVAIMVEVLPPDQVRGVAQFLAWIAADVLKIRASVLTENLRLAFPEQSDLERKQLIRRMWEHVFLLGYEILLTARKVHETNWRDYVRLCGHEEPLRKLLEGRPLILVTGHFGNFEIGGYVVSLLGVPLCSIARPIDNPFLDRYLRRLRSGAGQILIPKHGASDAVDHAARQGKTIAVLADQSAGPKGCFVDFFGHKASTFKAVAVLCLLHQAPLAVCHARRTSELFRFNLRVTGFFDPRVDQFPKHDVTAITQWFTSLLEAAIREAPQQYWWLHRRWKEKPPQMAITSRSVNSSTKAAA